MLACFRRLRREAESSRFHPQGQRCCSVWATQVASSPSLMAVKGMPSSVFIRIIFSATNCPFILTDTNTHGFSYLEV